MKPSDFEDPRFQSVLRLGRQVALLVHQEIRDLIEPRVIKRNSIDTWEIFCIALRYVNVIKNKKKKNLSKLK